MQRSTVQTTRTPGRENDNESISMMSKQRSDLHKKPGSTIEVFPRRSTCLECAFRKKLIRLRKELANHSKITIQMPKN